MEVVTKYLKTANKFKVATRALALAAVVTGGLMANSMVQKNKIQKIMKLQLKILVLANLNKINYIQPCLA